MKYTLFTGCTTPEKALGYELSARRLGWELGIRFLDAEFGCCGETVRKVDAQKAVILAARNLSEAERLGADVCTLCSDCTRFLSEVDSAMKGDGKFRGDVNAKLRLLGREYTGKTKVKHLVGVLHEKKEEIREKAEGKLGGLRIAVQGGCFGSEEAQLKELVEATGAKIVGCGEGSCLSMPVDEHTIKEMADKRLTEVGDTVDALVVGCPVCGIMLDRSDGIPVLYLPQLLGLALGFTDEDMGLRWSKSSVARLRDKI
jgi:heterodisulfide reductase subunit B